MRNYPTKIRPHAQPINFAHQPVHRFANSTRTLSDKVDAKGSAEVACRVRPRTTFGLIPAHLALSLERTHKGDALGASWGEFRRSCPSTSSDVASRISCKRSARETIQ